MKRGFTLMEILIVLGILAIVGGVALIVSLDAYRAQNFHSDRDLFISALERARAESMNNICLGSNCTDGQAHGVEIVNGTIVIFQGTYSPNGPENATFSMNIATTSGANQIVFSQLSGTTTGVTITVADQAGHTSVVTVSPQGQISWTN